MFVGCRGRQRLCRNCCYVQHGLSSSRRDSFNFDVLNQVVFNVLKNPNPLKDVEASALLDAAVLV